MDVLFKELAGWMPFGALIGWSLGCCWAGYKFGAAEGRREGFQAGWRERDCARGLGGVCKGSLKTSTGDVSVGQAFDKWEERRNK